MSTYRPVCDRWILARAKLLGGRKFYGAYPGGFPERARVLLGAWPTEPVLHVCGGMARFYPWDGGFGVNDKTLDLDPLTEPDFHADARVGPYPTGFRAVLLDPPYSPRDAANYRTGASTYPSPNLILGLALASLPPGGRAGMLHYGTPGMRKDAKFIASAAIMVGGNNRERVFSVFEKRASAGSTPVGAVAPAVDGGVGVGAPTLPGEALWPTS
jgi:hypothetical protein